MGYGLWAMGEGLWVTCYRLSVIGVNKGSSAKKYGLRSGISKSWFMKSPLNEPQWLAS